LARNGSGTYTIPVALVANTTATAADMNNNFSDIATALTGSVATNGEAPMTGQLPAFSGTLGAPGYSFNGDSDTGIYRSGANAFVFVCGGTAIATLSTTAFTMNVALAADTGIAVTAKVSGLGSVPVGAVMDFATTAAPTGWLLCYGQAVNRTTYSALFAVIGTTYGPGDGSTTFNLPDCRGRVRGGKDDMGGVGASRLTSAVSFDGAVQGGVGGSQGATLTLANLPAANLSPSMTATTLSTQAVLSYQTTGSFGAGGTSAVTPGGAIGVAYETTLSGVVPLGGSGTAHANVQPTIIFSTIIYAGV
jgi:microcystin-dependent protein